MPCLHQCVFRQILWLHSQKEGHATGGAKERHSRVWWVAGPFLESVFALLCCALIWCFPPLNCEMCECISVRHLSSECRWTVCLIVWHYCFVFCQYLVHFNYCVVVHRLALWSCLWKVRSVSQWLCPSCGSPRLPDRSAASVTFPFSPGQLALYRLSISRDFFSLRGLGCRHIDKYVVEVCGDGAAHVWGQTVV